MKKVVNQTPIEKRRLTNEKSYVPAPGMFPEYKDGCLASNRAQGYEPKIMSAEKYKKSDAEKEQLLNHKASYKANMRNIYGGNWKSVNRLNIPVKVDPISGKFIHVK